MTPTPRKSGIRLPWSHEEPDATQAAESGAEAPEASVATEAAPVEVGTQTATAAAPSPAAAAAPTQGANQPASAPETTTDPADNALLASLITAMRDVAERERESSVSTLRQSVDETVETLRTRAAEQAEQLRQRSEGDITAIGDWVNSETERIAAEGERRRETRRQLLTQQLSDHEQRSGSEIEGLYARIQEYERELTSFFAQLHEINDPAAFGTAAKRMPRPPSIASAAPAAPVPTAPSPADAAAETPAEAVADAVASSETTTEPETQEEKTDDQPAELMTAEAAEKPTAEQATAEATTSEAATSEGADVEAGKADEAEESKADEKAEEPAAAGRSTIVPDTHEERLSALGIDKNGSEADGSSDEAAAESAPSATADADAPSDPLRARLAELDAKIGTEASGEPATATVVAPGAGGEVATAIVVHGLGSFGAITSFKQALERVDGVHGISLSLGPTGEFVYRATHEADFDLVAAIEQIEHGLAQIERQADGSLRVVVKRGR
jgi:hypothetical protein